MKLQTIENKKGEVDYRKKLATQHFGEEFLYEEEYTASQMKKEFLRKIKRNKLDYKELIKKKITLSPYLEIGSGYGQAALLIENKFGFEGFASDLAIAPLSYIPKTAKTLKFNKIPKRIVIDAENIPFPDNSFPFVFCYQTLHHFPDPEKVIKEIHRVLTPGGVFFFSEEPVSQNLNLNLWYRPTRLRRWEKILKYTLILHFVSKIGKTEIDHGIIENTFTLSEWKKALSTFDKIETLLTPFPKGPLGCLEKNNFPNKFFIFFLGGGIRAICYKKGKTEIPKKTPGFLCPTCKKSKLTLNNKQLFCKNCHVKYFKKNNIWILLNPEVSQALYS